jgi:hypothetical protein
VKLPRHGVRNGSGLGLTAGLALFLVAAAAAPGRLVLKAAVLVEILLAHREHKFFTAVPTFDYLINVSHEASEPTSPDNDSQRPRRVSIVGVFLDGGYPGANGRGDGR